MSASANLFGMNDQTSHPKMDWCAGIAMVDRAAIFSELTKRNAIRREARLPLLDIHAEFVHAVELAIWKEACEEHADDIARIRDEAVATFIGRTAPTFRLADAGLSIMK